MKAKYIILSVFALAAAVACEKEGAHLMSEFQADKTYITIPETDGTVSVKVSATEDWTFDYEVSKDTTVRTADKGKQKKTKLVNQLEEFPWVSISPASGKAGETTITFKDNRKAYFKKINGKDPKEGDDLGSFTQTFKVKVGDKYQNILVTVGTAAKATVVTAKQLLGEDPEFAPVEGKTYRITGACQRIANTSYGNWYLKDDTSDKTVYIYGTVDATGAYNWSNLGIDVGDKVTVEGPYSLYGTTVELIDASVIKVEKALLSAVNGTTVYVGKEAKAFELVMEQKGTGLGFESKTDWLALDNSYTTNKKGNLVFTVTPAENTTGKPRSGEIWFKSTKTEKNKKGEDETLSSEVLVTIIQQADVVEAGSIKVIRDICATSTSSKSQALFDVVISSEKPATVTLVSGSYMFIEDETGGLTLYNSADKYSVGQKISGRIFGQGYAYNNVAQATAFNASLGKAAAAPSDPTKLPKGTEITLKKLLDEWDTWAFRLVTIKGLTVTKDGGIDATYPVNKDAEGVILEDPLTGKPAFDSKGKEVLDNGDIEGELSDGTNTIAVKINSESFLLKMEEGKAYDVTCVPTLIKGAKTLGLWSKDHVKKVEAE